MTSPRLFVFDLDGTLIDTIGDLTSSLNHALSLYGFAERTVGEVKAFIGNGMYMLVKRSCPDGTDEQTLMNIKNAFAEYYTDNVAVFSRSYDGMAALLKRLEAEGHKTAVLTNKDQRAAEVLIHKFFGGIKTVGVVSFDRRKPDPTSAFELLEYFGVAPRDAVMIGDSPADVLTAKNAGMRSVSVLWGYRTRKQLEPCLPDAFCDSPDALYDILINI